MFTYLFGRDFSVAISRLMLLGLIAVLPFVGGCGEDDNPIVDNDHDDEHEADAPIHADADGFTLEVDGKEVYHQHQGTHEGGLTVGVGEEIEVHVIFIDANEEEVHLDEIAGEDEDGHDEHDHDEEEAFSLSLTGYDSAIIEIHLEDEHDEHEDEDEHDEHGEEEELHFGLEGLKAGKTEIKLQLLHGDHADFTGALLIPVTVQ